MLSSSCVFFFLMVRRPPRSTRTDTLFPYTTLFRSAGEDQRGVVPRGRRAADRLDSTLVKNFVPFGRWIGTGQRAHRSEEHTSELQSLMRISYAVFCLKKKKTERKTQTHNPIQHMYIENDYSQNITQTNTKQTI